MIYIDRSYALTLLRQVVEERGADFVYRAPNASRCRYEWDNAPSCGVGVALHRAGLPVSILAKLDEDAGEIIDAEARELLGDHGVILSENAAAALGEFQHSQDSGERYGQALSAAIGRGVNAQR